MTVSRPFCTAIVLAGGSGSRMGTSVKKQFLELDGRPLLYYSMKCFQESPLIDRIILVSSADSTEYCRKEIVEKYGFSRTEAIISGGAQRYDSVYAGLCACGDLRQDELVFVHDSARPFLTEEILRRCYAAAEENGACSAGMPSKDTVNLTDENGMVQTVPDRERVWIVQTPQVFRLALLKEAHEKLRVGEMQGVTDDVMVVRRALGVPVMMARGDYRNIKITTPDDLALAEGILKTFTDEKKP